MVRECSVSMLTWYFQCGPITDITMIKPDKNADKNDKIKAAVYVT